MFDFSLAKLFLLGLIALLVLGPEKMVKLARTAGAMLRKLRQSWDHVREDITRELEIEELKRTAREAAAKAEKAQTETSEVIDKMRHELDEVRKEAEQAKHEVEGENTDEHDGDANHPGTGKDE